MSRLNRVLSRNVLVAMCAAALSYALPTFLVSVDNEISGMNEIYRSAHNQEPHHLPDGVDPFDIMSRSMLRLRFICVPVGVLAPALLVAWKSRRWQWAWLVTLIGCSPGLLVVALTSNDNLGYGLTYAAATYVLTSGLVSSVVCLREHREAVAA